MTTPGELPSLPYSPRPDAASKSQERRAEAIRERIDAIETLLRTAGTRLVPRTEWPAHLKRFPFSVSARLQRAMLRVLEVLFRDQREFNASVSQALREVVRALRATIGEFEEFEERLRAGDERMRALDARMDAIDAQQSHLIERIAAVDAARTGSAASAVKASDDQQGFDRFYAAFENRYRGSEAEISDRLRVYLPIVAATKAIDERTPLVDLGCGRGEWLELLRGAGFAARGVDINRVTIDSCRARGLDVVEASGVEYLRNLPAATVGAITGFHLIEHLPFDALLSLFHEAARVLRPGGVIVVETPNPENVIVGSHKFYLDPTHVRPLPPELVLFAAEFQGLERGAILGLHPWPTELLQHGSPLAEEFNVLFRGPQDYAVIAYRT